METLEVLSETVVSVLREFSIGKRPVNAANLKDAFSTREEILSLLLPALDASPGGKSEGASAPLKMPARVPPAKAETPQNTTTSDLSVLRDAFLKILRNLTPVIKGDYETQFVKLKKKINDCESYLQLGLVGELVGKLVGDLIDDAVDRIDYSNDFLVVFSKDLYKMEERLLSFQSYNRDTHQLNSEFHNGLLSHTDELHRAIDSSEILPDIRNYITSKLSAISKAIEVKNQSDEFRAKETDAKIAELHNNVKTYNKEIIQITERADLLEKEVMLDELTEISNRRAFDLQMRESLRRYHRNGDQFSLILIDVDNFKKVNDKYGHKAGDKCLKELAQLIRTSLRKSDFFARYGGEELIAVLHGSDVMNAQEVAEKIRLRIVRTRFCYQAEVIPITVSLGVTEVAQTDEDPETPFIRADNALYQAKSLGRNRVCAL